jgi:hypothetical protein
LAPVARILELERLRRDWIVKNDESIVAIEVPEADALEQRQPIEFDFETGSAPGLGTTDLNVTDRDANEADVIDQATIVAEADDEWDFDR